MIYNLLPVYNFMAKGLLKELVLPFLQDNWRIVLILRDLHVFFSCSLSSCFFILFSIAITSLGEEGASLCVSRTFVCLFVLYVLVFVVCVHL